jgi:hypothetical protein
MYNPSFSSQFRIPATLCTKIPIWSLLYNKPLQQSNDSMKEQPAYQAEKRNRDCWSACMKIEARDEKYFLQDRLVIRALPY